MSIGLFICYHDSQREDRLVPIASDEVFHHHWKPICAELGLIWLPRMAHNWLLSARDLVYVLDELSRLRRYLSCGETHSEVRHHLLARISVIMRELHHLSASMEADAFVGSVRPCSTPRPVLVEMTPQTPAHRPDYPLPGTTASVASSPGMLRRFS